MATKDSLNNAYLRENTRVRSSLIAALVRFWRSLGSYRDEDVKRFVPTATAMVLGGQQQTSALTSAYMAQQKATLLGTPFRATSVPLSKVSGKATRVGVTPEEVYRRPLVEVWRQMGNGTPFDKAVEIAEQRLVKIAQTDLQLSKTKTAQQIIRDDRLAVAYQRVLVGDFNCALCTIASTQLYEKETLMPLHPACDCAVGPVYDFADFDEDERLRQAHAAVKREFGKSAADGRQIDYRKLILVRENSETGSILTVASHKFTDLSDLSRKK